jgi:deoxyribose-phosphate aldolase
MITVELSRLIAIVAQEVIAASHRPVSRCACHAVSEDCCPERWRGILDAGATRVGVHAIAGAPGDVAALIDHTLLRPDATRSDIDRLCDEARQFGFATVCVNPTWVGHAAARLRGSAVGVTAVVGFPLGATTADVKACEARRVIVDGAREVDTVINIGALKSGDLRTVERDVDAVVQTCHECGALTKVILETALLTDAEKVAACTIAKAAGADFVKTSTGFGPGGATVADVALMRRVVGDDMGIKAAGGVGDLETLRAMVDAGATRIGASAGVRIVGGAIPDCAESCAAPGGGTAPTG